MSKSTLILMFENPTFLVEDNQQHKGKVYFSFHDLISGINTMFTPCDYGIQDNTARTIDSSVRSSSRLQFTLHVKFNPLLDDFIHEKASPYNLLEPPPKNFLEILSERDWTLLRYEVGGHFDFHCDQPTLIPDPDDPSKMIESNCTVLLFPPANILEPFEGGDLNLDDNKMFNHMGHIIIPSRLKSWTLVTFPHNTPHACFPVTKGVRYVFKTHDMRKIRVAESYAGPSYYRDPEKYKDGRLD